METQKWKSLWEKLPWKRSSCCIVSALGQQKTDGRTSWSLRLTEEDQTIKESEGVSPRWNNLQPAAASLSALGPRENNQSPHCSAAFLCFMTRKPCAASPAPSYNYYLHSLCLLHEREEGRGCCERYNTELQEWRTKRNQVKPPTALRMPPGL